MHWYRVGQTRDLLGHITGNPGTTADIVARTPEEAQAQYANKLGNCRRPYTSYEVQKHTPDSWRESKECQACGKLFCEFSWG